jgi:pantetheine-phosphate adenylyltransferase
MTKPLVGVYPGTFDPLTNGHLDIISRATTVVHRLVVGIAVNAGKDPLFSLEERQAMVEEVINTRENDNGTNIDIIPFDNLLMDFVKTVDAAVIVRGLRAVSDFEYEFQMAGMNSRLNPSVETVFLMASEHHQFISSRLVKEIGTLGGDISHFVPPLVASKLTERLGSSAARKGHRK